MKPLNICNYSLYCFLGGNKNDICAKLNAGMLKEFHLKKLHEDQYPVATIDESTLLPVAQKKFDNRVNRLLQAAISELDESIKCAVQKFGSNRIGIFLGSCCNGAEISVNASRIFNETGLFPQDFSLELLSAVYPAKYIAARYNLNGIVSVQSTACASSASAFVSARNNIYANNCDAAIVGGVDIASVSALQGFCALEALSTKHTNPFSANRSGLNLGDGAAFFLVTAQNVDCLQTNECKGLCVSGFGESSDATHITAPRADGLGAFLAMKEALDDAKISASDIGYINLHGTGTFLNDSMEAKAVNKLFGDSVCASSTKPFTGHTLGAAGALEAAFCCMSLNTKMLPAHVFDNVLDNSLPRVHFVKKSEILKTAHCLTNSFAFGGCNVALVISKNG